MRSGSDYQAAADWAEHDMDLRGASGGAVRRGAAAAAHGRELLEQAAGGPAQLDKLLRGRPSIDPDAGPGEHSRVRQVRLPAAQNRQLDELAAAEGRRPSDIMRDAVAQYLTTYRAG